MPLIEVEVVAAANAEHNLRAAQPSVRELAQRIADEVGEAMASGPARTWVRLRFLPRDHYAENGVALDDEAMPVFVTVMEAHRPNGSALVEQTVRVTAAVASPLDRPPESVHVLYAEDGAGRVAFGGSALIHRA